MRFVIQYLLLCFLAGSVSAGITFDGDKVFIPSAEWLLLDEQKEPAPENLATDINQFNWVPVASKDMRMEGHGIKVLRLDLTITYEGSQQPLLLIPYAFVPRLTVGLFANGEVIMWQSLEKNLQADLDEKMTRPTGMLTLPVVHPGDYQLIIKGSTVANLVLLRGATLQLDREYMLRDYPSRVSVSSGVLGALSTYIICCLAMMVYRFRLDLLYATAFLMGSFFVLYLREGISFLSFDMDVSWWMMHILPTMMAISHFGILFLVAEDMRSTGWHKSRMVLYGCGWITLLVGFINIFFPSREHLFIGLPGMLSTFLGFFVALVLLVIRAFRSGLRDRLFTIFIGCYFVVMFYRASLAVFSTAGGVPVTSLYVATNFVGIFIFVEYLLTSAREYLNEKSRQSADLTRIDLVNRFSHELRTPLNAVIGLADLMRGSQDLKRIDRYAGMIQTAGNTLLDLVSDILDFSKLGNKSIQLEQHALRLDELLSEVMMSFIQQATATGVVPATNIEEGVPFYLIGDDLRMKQIFSNLLSNSIKFTPKGKSVFLNIKKGSELGDRVELLCTVKDQGRGIPEDKLDSIFEPYTQAKAEDGGHLRGTGLGLAICKLLIQQMGGEVTVTSQEGVGTTIAFNLWLKRDTEGPDLDELFAPLQGKQLLFVSTHPSVTGMVANYFRYWGASVEVVTDADQGVRSEYDLALIDSALKSAEHNAPWIDRQPVSTVIEISQLKVQPWVTRLQHPNVHDLQLPIALLEIIAQCVGDLTGEPVRIAKRQRNVNVRVFNDHHILLVDDNKVNLTVASKLLESMGVDCVTAESGSEAIRLLQEAPMSYTLVLLDCEMPDMSGFEVSRRWRDFESREHLSRTPIVALTAHALNEVSTECFSAGMDEVLYKPIGREALSNVLARFSAQSGVAVG